MNRTTIFKGFALANFVILLTVFLLYKNGSFDSFIYNNKENLLTSPNGGTATKTDDSLSVKFDSLDVIRFSSSKSMQIFDDIELVKDTSNTDSSDLIRKKKRLMYSSKSGKIIDPSLFILDSLKKEQKSKKKKTKN